MKVAWPVEIAGTGTGLPKQVVTNADFEKRLDTSHEWIVQRTGICERRFAGADDSTLSMALTASRGAIADAGLEPKDIDLILCATITPEHPLPTTSCELQGALGCRQIPAIDQVCACSGFVWGVITAAQYIMGGLVNNVLVVGAETMSRITDPEDRSTVVLFGDAAGAAIVRRATSPERSILAARMGADGSDPEILWIPAGGSKLPASPKTLAERLGYVRMNGREVFKFAVSKMIHLLEETLADAGVAVDDISLVVPHQSNRRIIESACSKLHLDASKVIVNIDRYGNTSAASIAVALHEARQQGRVKPGDLVMLLAFGAGLTWGSLLLRA